MTYAVNIYTGEIRTDEVEVTPPHVTYAQRAVQRAKTALGGAAVTTGVYLAEAAESLLGTDGLPGEISVTAMVGGGATFLVGIVTAYTLAEKSQTTD